MNSGTVPLGLMGHSLLGKVCVFSPGLHGYPWVFVVVPPPQSHMLTGDCKCPPALSE